MGISFSLYARVKQALEAAEGRKHAEKVQAALAAVPTGGGKGRVVRARQPGDAAAAGGGKRAGKQQQAVAAAARGGRH